MYKYLLDKIISKNAKIGIIGQGYVGLSLSCQLAEKGFYITGFEVDAVKVKMIHKGESYIDDISSNILKKLVATKRMSADLNFKNLAKMDVVIICVPTPLRKSKDPDISYILEATKNVRDTMKKGQLIILESTTYPGTTEEVVLKMLQESGLVVGRDFFLAFSPERVDPLNKKFNIGNTPKVVGGITTKCSNLAAKIYFSFTEVYKVSSTRTAEMVKLLENTFRAVNIALVNEVALMCDKLSLNVWEVINAASTKPFGFMPFYPGPGIGGHCIPLDPHYLSWKLKTLNFYSRFIDLASDLNAKMPGYVVSKLQNALNLKSKALKNSKILVLGVAYKKDISDYRESPAIDVINILIEKMANVFYYDSHVPDIKNYECAKKLTALKNLNNLDRFDAVVIVTDHSDINYKKILKDAKIIIDTRNVFNNIKSNKVIRI